MTSSLINNRISVLIMTLYVRNNTDKTYAVRKRLDF